MVLRDLLAPSTGRHTAPAMARRRIADDEPVRHVRPPRTVNGPCPCHPDTDPAKRRQQ